MSSNRYHKPLRICSYKIRQSGRGAVITLPAAYLDDLGLKPGDILNVSRDAFGRLIFAPAREATP